MARHVRHKHKDAVATYECKVDGCRRKFLRQDARLKHYRKAHEQIRADLAIPRGGNGSRQSNDDGTPSAS
jgi:hypothetical protein